LPFIVDGMNVIGTEPNGWWRDRAGARRRLVDELSRWGGDGDEITVVFDGRPTPAELDQAPATGMTVSFAPGGPNAADDAIVALVQTLVRPDQTVVVSSDRALVDRVRRLGAQVESAKSFRGRLEGPR
jgi:predicted RNA-binding protein with PIN domain